MIDCTQVSVAGTAAVSLGIVPPGAASIVVVNGSGTVPVYLGAGVTQPGTASPLTGCGIPVAGGASISLGQYLLQQCHPSMGAEPIRRNGAGWPHDLERKLGT